MINFLNFFHIYVSAMIVTKHEAEGSLAHLQRCAVCVSPPLLPFSPHKTGRGCVCRSKASGVKPFTANWPKSRLCVCVHTCQDNWFQGAPECLPLVSPVLKRPAVFALGIVPQRKHLQSCTCTCYQKHAISCWPSTHDCIPFLSVSLCTLFICRNLIELRTTL